MKKIFKGAIFVLFLVTFLMSSAQTSFASSTIFGTTGSGPRGIVIDGSGNIYVANTSSNNVSKITPEGVSTILGTTGSSPQDITIDGGGNIYTANVDANNVTKITPGGVSSTLGTTSAGPRNITIDGAGNIYTSNTNANNVTKITPGGVSTTLASTGTSPRGILMGSDGNIYTANYGSNNVSKITPGGVSTILGTTGVGPYGIVMDGDGNIYTSNSAPDFLGGTPNVSKITPGGVSTILGTTDSSPFGITIDASNNIYTTNTSSNNVSKITPGGVSTILGTTGSSPQEIAINGDEDIFVTNGGSDNVTKIDNPIHDAAVSSLTYTVSAIGGGAETITNVPYGGVAKADFLANLTKGALSQTWDDTAVSDPVVTGDILVVTAEDTTTVTTYTITINDPSNDATISAANYTVSAVGGGAETITNVPFGTAKADFLADLSGNQDGQTWDDVSIQDPVVTGDTLVVTAEDGTTVITYTVTTNAELSHDATVTSAIYTVSAIGGGAETITNIPFNTSRVNFLANLTMGQEGQSWDTSNINNSVLTNNTLVVTAEDEVTEITYTLTVNGQVPFYWFNSGADADWETLAGNWWTDTEHTEQALALPTGLDEVITIGIPGTGPEVDLDTWIEPASIDATNTGISFTSVAFTWLNMSITGDATFNGVINYNGTLLGDATFNDESCNVSASTVDGNAIFNNGSCNDNNGVVSGNASFYDASINYGTVEGNACFAETATNSGTVLGSVSVCAVPPTLTTSPATLLTETGVTLNGEMTNNGGEDATSRGFNWGLTDSYGTTVTQASGPYGTGTFSTILSDLACNTTYHYRVFAINTSGTSYGSDVSFTTNNCPSSSGSSRRVSVPQADTTCSPGDKFSTTTGLPCTSFSSNSSTNSGPTACTITLTLRQGNTGNQVKCLQTKLNIISDGIFGPITKASVINFQKAHLLVPDGIVGPITRGEMNKI